MATKPKLGQPRKLDEIQKRDLFYTPNYAVELLVPFIPDYIDRIIEPACGNGKISNVLTKEGFIVESFDLEPTYNKATKNNFLSTLVPLQDYFKTAIVTNPPYSLKEQFYKRCLEYGLPFALLIPADYCGWLIDAVWKDGCEKIIPNRRINFIPPFILERVNEEYMTYFTDANQLPKDVLFDEINSSGAMVHSMWLTYGFNIGRSETFVELTKKMKENI